VNANCISILIKDCMLTLHNMHDVRLTHHKYAKHILQWMHICSTLFIIQGLLITWLAA
jgi:hypothetical protein